MKKNVRVYFVDDTFRLISVGDATTCEQFRASINERINLPEGYSELFAVYEVEKSKRECTARVGRSVGRVLCGGRLLCGTD